jgi:hypothetical protein
VRAVLPETNVTNPWCDVNTTLLRVTALGSYTVPKIDVLVATTFRSEQGSSWRRTTTRRPANTTLGGLLRGEHHDHVNLIEPGTLYGDRANQLDLRIAKNLRFGGTRTNVGWTSSTSSTPTRCYRTTRPTRRPPPRGCGRRRSSSRDT